MGNVERTDGERERTEGNGSGRVGNGSGRVGNAGADGWGTRVRTDGNSGADGWERVGTLGNVEQTERRGRGYISGGDHLYGPFTPSGRPDKPSSYQECGVAGHSRECKDPFFGILYHFLQGFVLWI